MSAKLPDYGRGYRAGYRAGDAKGARRLRKENAALRADKERLDWLIKNQIGVAYGAVSFEAFDKITRDAIDAARKEVKP